MEELHELYDCQDWDNDDWTEDEDEHECKDGDCPECGTKLEVEDESFPLDRICRKCDYWEVN